MPTSDHYAHDGLHRHIQFDACFNFRDLGGYETISGRRVRTGAVFRSDSLHRLTTRDRKVIGGLGLRAVIDLRSTDEIKRSGGPFHTPGATYHHMPMYEEDTRPFPWAQPDDPEPPPGESYVATATTGMTAIAAALRVIAEDPHPVVFQCQAGKDRTGILAALVLAALGVPDETIAADYYLSDRAAAATLKWAEANDPETATQLAALPDWLQRAPTSVMHAFLNLLHKKHGSIVDFLHNTGVPQNTLETLQNRLLA